MTKKEIEQFEKLLTKVILLIEKEIKSNDWTVLYPLKNYGEGDRKLWFNIGRFKTFISQIKANQRKEIIKEVKKYKCGKHKRLMKLLEEKL